MAGFTKFLLNILDLAGDELLKVIVGDSYEKLKSLLKTKPVRQAIKTASSESINTYRLSPSPNVSFLSELESKGNFLEEKTTKAEVLKLFSSYEKPNVIGMAATLADNLDIIQLKNNLRRN